MPSNQVIRSASRAATLGELLCFIWPLEAGQAPIPWWPPDVYAVTATVLRRTGGYVRAMALPRSGVKGFVDGDWPEKAVGLGDEWRKQINKVLEREGIVQYMESAIHHMYRSAVVAPKEVRKWWQFLLKNLRMPIERIGEHEALTECLVKLCCVADQASRGIGVRRERDAFLLFAAWLLDSQEGRTVCAAIPVDRIAVLPKQHTPQRGLTLRSLTHNLSLHPATEVTVRWNNSWVAEELEIINLLLLPWPIAVQAQDFRVFQPKDRDVPFMPEASRFFAYEPEASITRRPFEKCLVRAFEAACEHAQRVHGIVFPEGSLSLREYEIAERFVLEREAFLVAGVHTLDGEVGPRARNVCMFQAAGLLQNLEEDVINDRLVADLRVVQGKHHRWCLDRPQILQYGLGGRLPASKDCWELTDVEEREVTFFTMDSWLTWAVLICEDLARQDPVADVIRAVGPNMVVALLMDGPQLKERWPSRYASVLAEDPGCSVLTLTSLGMSRRTRPAHVDNDRSNVIALWRDAHYGVKEIELQEGHDSCVLSLVCKSATEYTADGRSDGGVAHFPVYAGSFSFECAG